MFMPLLPVLIGCSLIVLGPTPPEPPRIPRGDPPPIRVVEQVSNLPVHAATLGQEPPILQIRNIRTGQVIRPSDRSPPAPRDPIVVFDNLSSPNSSAMLNIAYVHAGSYDGSDPSQEARILPLGERTAVPNFNMAYRDIPNGIPAPTDIVWNDYASDPALWPGQPTTNNWLRQVELVLYLRNNFPIPPATTPATRHDTIRVLFFSADGTVFHDGFAVTYTSPPNYNAYFHATFDLSAFNPPLAASRDGLIMLDWAEPNDVGVGAMFAGGDLSFPGFPTPESLITTGSADPLAWAFADGATGNASHPGGVDPGFDGDPAVVSYLDVLNTGALTNWQVGGVIAALAHDFPCRVTIVPSAVQTGACTVAHPFACFLTTRADCLAQNGTYLGDGAPCPPTPQGACVITLPAPSCVQTTEADCLRAGGMYRGDNAPCPSACRCDFNDSGALNSQDFFDFIQCLFTGTCPPGHTGDFNGNGTTDSQDFFDFLGCLFSPPPGC